MRVSRQLKYVVLKPLRYSGRGYKPGDVFNARRADPPMGRLRKWCEMGVLGHPEAPEPEPEEQEPSEAQLVALEALAAAEWLNADDEESEPKDEPEAEEPAESEGAEAESEGDDESPEESAGDEPEAEAESAEEQPAAKEA